MGPLQHLHLTDEERLEALHSAVARNASLDTVTKATRERGDQIANVHARVEGELEGTLIALPPTSWVMNVTLTPDRAALTEEPPSQHIEMTRQTRRKALVYLDRTYELAQDGELVGLQHVASKLASTSEPTFLRAGLSRGLEELRAVDRGRGLRADAVPAWRGRGPSEAAARRAGAENAGRGQSLTGEVKSLTTEVESLTTEVESLTTEVEAADERCRSRVEESEVEQRIAEAVAEVERVNGEESTAQKAQWEEETRARLDAVNLESGRRTKEQNENWSKLHQELTGAKMESVKVKGDLEDAQREREDARRELGDARQELGDARQGREDARQELVNVRGGVDAAAGEAAAQIKRLATQDERLVTQDKRLVAQEKSLSVLQQQKHVVDLEIVACQGKLEMAQPGQEAERCLKEAERCMKESAEGVRVDLVAAHQREVEALNSTNDMLRGRVSGLELVERELSEARVVRIPDLERQLVDRQHDVEQQKIAREHAEANVAREQTTATRHAAKIGDLTVQVQGLVVSEQQKTQSLEELLEQLRTTALDRAAAQVHEEDATALRKVEQRLRLDCTSLSTALSMLLADRAGERSVEEIVKNVCRGVSGPRPGRQRVRLPAALAGHVPHRRAVDHLAEIELCLAWLKTGAEITDRNRQDVLAAAVGFARSCAGHDHQRSAGVTAMLRILELGVRVGMALDSLKPVWDAFLPTLRKEPIRETTDALWCWLRDHFEKDDPASMLDYVVGKLRGPGAPQELDEFGKATGPTVASVEEAGVANPRRLACMGGRLVLMVPQTGFITEFAKDEVSISGTFIGVGSKLLCFREPRRVGTALSVDIPPFAVDNSRWIARNLPEAINELILSILALPVRR
ncbi:hypothetical protein LTR53_016314 [Teratosphaeriaceae sp. CCFEE 6253]|nr:hypothetical protein LTR53_016314 [Teratosphaeriaceae sp. CCFEE 6253]